MVAFGVHAILTEGRVRPLSGLMSSFVLNLVPDGRTVRMYNITRPKYSRPAWCREDLAGGFGLLAQGKLRPVVAERIPLIETALEEAVPVDRVRIVPTTAADDFAVG